MAPPKTKKVFNTVHETDAYNGVKFDDVDIDRIDVKSWKKPVGTTVYEKNRHKKRKCLSLGCETNAGFYMDFCERHADD